MSNERILSPLGELLSSGLIAIIFDFGLLFYSKDLWNKIQIVVCVEPKLNCAAFQS